MKFLSLTAYSLAALSAVSAVPAAADTVTPSTTNAVTPSTTNAANNVESAPVDLSMNAPVTIPIKRRKHPNQSRLARILLGKEHTLHKYKIHFNKKKFGMQRFAWNSTTDSLISGPGSGSAPLKNFKNQLYSAPVVIGKGQHFNLDLDTGSSDTWVRGAKCETSEADKRSGLDSCRGNKLEISDSSIVAIGSDYKTRYGSGEVRGLIYTAPVSMAGMTATIPIGVSTYEDGFDDDGASDGLLGLGFDSISQISHKVKQSASYIDQLGLSGSRNVFGFYFSNYNDRDNGQVTIGGYDTTKIGSPITYIPLNDQSYWQFDFKSATYQVGSKTGRATGSSKNAIADTGTTLIVLDQEPADQINAAIGAEFDKDAGAYIIDCKVAKTGPDVTFNFGGSSFSIPASIYVFHDDSGVCFSGIGAGASELGSVIFGDVFLRQYYSIYDKTNNRVGFALAKHKR